MAIRPGHPTPIEGFGTKEAATSAAETYKAMSREWLETQKSN